MDALPRRILPGSRPHRWTLSPRCSHRIRSAHGRSGWSRAQTPRPESWSMVQGQGAPRRFGAASDWMVLGIRGGDGGSVRGLGAALWRELKTASGGTRKLWKGIRRLWSALKAPWVWRLSAPLGFARFFCFIYMYVCVCLPVRARNPVHARARKCAHHSSVWSRRSAPMC